MPVPFSDVSCVVVHHNSPQTVIRTAEALVDSGLERSAIVVVDNSGDHGLVRQLAARGFSATQVENRGYAAAVNDGLAWLHAAGLRRALTLISTHETVPEPGAVGALRDAITSDARVAVAGPTLLLDSGDNEVWSAGGELTPRLHMPRHVRELPADDTRRVIDRDWLDGAFTLYRTTDLEEFGLEELFFLYFEETDLHTRLRRAGRRIVWVPGAVVRQASSGTPDRLIGRNMFLFHQRQFSRWSGRAAVGFAIFKSVAKAVLGRTPFSAPRDIAAGWLDGERLATGRRTRHPYPSEKARP